jgi:hypothetical protein
LELELMKIYNRSEREKKEKGAKKISWNKKYAQ